MRSALEILAEGLADRRMEALLIGGFALPAYGVVRQTVDLDCLIADTDEETLLTILSEAGYVEKARATTFIRYSHSSPALTDVDVLLVDRDTFDKMRRESRPYRAGSVALRIPSLPHLVALKLHAIRNNPKRELRDLADIAELLRANPNAVSRSELRALCERYGPAGIVSKLEEHL